LAGFPAEKRTHRGDRLMELFQEMYLK
jgi:hypothetical protein